jgi:hypothetical protein
MLGKTEQRLSNRLDLKCSGKTRTFLPLFLLENLTMLNEISLSKPVIVHPMHLDDALLNSVEAYMKPNFPCMLA